jgi:subtilisin family serine protease
MKTFSEKVSAAAGASPSDLLRVAVTFPRASGDNGPVKFGARLSTDSAVAMTPSPLDVDRGIFELQKAGFEVSARGKLAVSMRCTREQYEKTFGTKLSVFDSPQTAVPERRRFYYPDKGAPWAPQSEVARLIDDAYIQWPHIYMDSTRRKPAKMAGGLGGGPNLGYFYLSAPKGLQQMLNVTAAHKAKITGKGVRVAMIDTGFDQRHSWFGKFRDQSRVVLAPGASGRLTDLNGHGTGESANVFSVAPGCTFIGVKVENDSNPQAGASILEGFQEALRHRPHIITVSMGYDLRTQTGNNPLNTLPNSLVPLEAEIQAAIAAGNGHYSFPGQMPNVISAGGTFVSRTGARQASDYSSAFPSAIYRGRSVPDFCGLVGMLPAATYIRLPVPRGCEIDRDMAAADHTGANDGWGVFSGTSAAAPQIAGICALLLQKNRSLTPREIKAVLRGTSRDVTTGHANPVCDPSHRGGVKASAGADGATGTGLVDAMAALRQV